MTQSPLVSVVIPCFNYARFLGEALESVRQQSLGEWECIVVDDGSTDDSVEVAKSFVADDPRFSCVRRSNRGPSAARNAGLAKAHGEYVQLVDADDLLEPDKLAVQAAFLAGHPKYAMVYSPMRFFTDAGGLRSYSRGRNRAQKDWMTLWPDTTDALLVALVEGNTFPISAPLFRRSALEAVGKFDESLPSHEDWEFWLRWAFAGKRFFGLDAPGTRTLIREHRDSLTRRTVVMAETRLVVRERIMRLAPTEVLRAKNRECMSYDQCELGAAHLSAGHWRTGLRWYLSGISTARSKTRAARILGAHVIPDQVLSIWRRLRWGAPNRENA